MIRYVKRVLSAFITDPTNNKEVMVNDELLLTIMAEVQCIINSHPLMALSVDPDDFDAISPNSPRNTTLDRANPIGTLERV